MPNNHRHISRRAEGNGYEHVLLVEKLLGKKLPKGAVIHHIDRDGFNNEHSNLVVCQDQGYHMLIHKREEALKACGHADWKKCKYCGRWDDTKNMLLYENANYSLTHYYHRNCPWNKRVACRYKRRQSNAN